MKRKVINFSNSQLAFLSNLASKQNIQDELLLNKIKPQIDSDSRPQAQVGVLLNFEEVEMLLDLFPVPKSDESELSKNTRAMLRQLISS